MHDGGAARIIAPAGSGKTRVLTERARHLVRQWQLPVGDHAGGVQQTSPARDGRAPARRPGLQVRTLNAIALAIVNGTPPFAPRSRRFDTVDEGEVRRILGRLVRFPRKRNADPVATWIEALSVARLGCDRPSGSSSCTTAMSRGSPRCSNGTGASSTARRPRLRRTGAARSRCCSTTPPPAAAQRACRLMLVDEFQDLTPAHLLLVRLLAGPDGAVFGVGDDDQTIYGYNGADPAWLIDFAELFPGAGEHPLEVNYRCPADVVAAADQLLRHNGVRVAKTIRARSDAPVQGLVVEAGDAPVDTTVALVTGAVADGTPTSDIAVLTRVNSLLAPVQVALGARGIAVAGGVGRDFAERTAVRAALAWLRLATGGERLDPDDVAEALRRPSRSLHPQVAQWLGEQRSVEAMRKLAGRVNGERDAMRIEEFAADVARLQRLAANHGTTGAILGALRDSMGLASSIQSLDHHRRGMNRAAQNDDLVAVAQLADLQPDPRRFERWLRDALSRPWQPDGVTLATVHRVKGQEWPMVVVHQADADQFPHRLADDVAEERRVFHVAITRGSQRVHVVPDTTPSPFVAQMFEPPPPPRVRRPTAEPPAPARAGGSGGSATSGTSARPGQSLTGDDAVMFAAEGAPAAPAAGKPAHTVLPDAAPRRSSGYDRRRCRSSPPCAASVRRSCACTAMPSSPRSPVCEHSATHPTRRAADDRTRRRTGRRALPSAPMSSELPAPVRPSTASRLPSRQGRRTGRGRTRHHRRDQAGVEREPRPADRRHPGRRRCGRRRREPLRRPSGDGGPRAPRRLARRRPDHDHRRRRLGGAAATALPHLRRSRRRGGVPVAFVRGVPGVHPFDGRSRGDDPAHRRPHVRPRRPRCRRHRRHADGAARHPEQPHRHPLSTDQLRSFLARVSSRTVVVIDEAYREFLDPAFGDPVHDVVPAFPNVVDADVLESPRARRLAARLRGRPP
ncbi:MAG: 3'-5' exonuclease [Ilumatobacteraceae bacterium]